MCLLRYPSCKVIKRRIIQRANAVMPLGCLCADNPRILKRHLKSKISCHFAACVYQYSAVCRFRYKYRLGKNVKNDYVILVNIQFFALQFVPFQIELPSVDSFHCSGPSISHHEFRCPQSARRYSQYKTGYEPVLQKRPVHVSFFFGRNPFTEDFFP